MGLSASVRKNSQGRKPQIKCHWIKNVCGRCTLEGFTVLCELNQEVEKNCSYVVIISSHYTHNNF